MNDVNFGKMSFQQAAAALTDPKIMKKDLKFVNAKEYYMKKYYFLLFASLHAIYFYLFETK